MILKHPSLFSDARSTDTDSTGSFSSIFSAMSDIGRASVNAIMGTPSQSNSPAHHRSSKQRRRKMTGFDVKKLSSMTSSPIGVAGGGGGFTGGGDFIQRGVALNSPRSLSMSPSMKGATPTHFSDLVDILHNGQRQGVLVFRGGSGLAISSPRPPASVPPTSATDRTFLVNTEPSPFPFDRKVHRQGLSATSGGFSSTSGGFSATPSGFSNNGFSSSPSSFSATPFSSTSSSFFPSTPSSPSSSPFTNSFGGSGFSSPVATPTFSSNLKFPEETTINQIIENFGSLPGTAPLPEKLMIQVLEQQKLGSKLKTSSGPVNQQQQTKPKRKRKKKNKKNKNKNKQVVTNAEELVAELRRQGKNVAGPSISFLTSPSQNSQRTVLSNPAPVPKKPAFNNNRNQKSANIQVRPKNTNFDFRTGRQTNTDKVVVPGFPNGLPSQTPEGVKLALASAVRGKNK